MLNVVYVYRISVLETFIYCFLNLKRPKNVQPGPEMDQSIV